MIKYPELRLRLYRALKALSDYKFQKDCWVDGICIEETEYYDFEEIVHFFFDDTTLVDDPAACIGYILSDDHEAQLIKTVTNLLSYVLDKYGVDLDDEIYIGLSEWSDIIDSSSDALETIYKQGFLKS